MVKFLIATHGFLADGFKSSINVLMGEEIADSVSCVNAFVENGTDDPKGEIKKHCEDIKNDEYLIILTDVMYGSVNQFALPYVNNKNIFVVTGVNFPLIMEIISKLTFAGDDVEVNKEILDDIVEKSKDQLICVDCINEDASTDDFFE